MIAEPLAVCRRRYPHRTAHRHGHERRGRRLRNFLQSPQSDPGEWQRHAEGQFGQRARAGDLRADAVTSALAALRVVDAAQHYEQLAARGLAFGRAFRACARFVAATGRALGDSRAAGGIDQWQRRLRRAPGAVGRVPAGHECGDCRAGRPRCHGRRRTCRSPSDRSPCFARRSARSRSHARVAAPAVRKRRYALRRSHGIRQHGRRGALAAASRCALPRTEPQRMRAPNRSTRSRGSAERSEDAAWMPPPAELAARVAPALGPLLGEHGADAYQAAFVELEALSTEWIRIALVELGWHPPTGRTCHARRAGGATGRRPAAASDCWRASCTSWRKTAFCAARASTGASNAHWTR